MGKNLILPIGIIILAGIGFYYSLPETKQNSKTLPNQSLPPETPTETVLAQGLDTPWAIAFLPDGKFLVTERKGTVRLIDPSGNLKLEPVATLNQVKEIGEGGLLGIALHPDFISNNLVYLYYTYSGDGKNTLNRVVRMKYKNGQLSDEQIIVDNVPGAPNHNGGRIKFGPDKYLYITTGDAQEPSLAQDKNSLAGKILRVTNEGKTAPGNPFNNLVYSYGHRNPQGITWSKGTNVLYETEHGPSGGKYGTGQDEFNYIEAGKNYGWPLIIGNQTKMDMQTPWLHSGKDTWAPAGAAYYSYSDFNNSIFFGGLKGQSLYELNIIGDNRDLKTHFKEKYGRIREVILGLDNMLYITTSNRDGRGVPKPEDDRIIRINPSKL